MGTYVNPGSAGFSSAREGRYIDKSGLIAEINKVIGSKDKLICTSRPRRFGKSYAAQMLSAYYDCSGDSHALFDDLTIAATPAYEQHLNRYNVIYLDMASVKTAAGGYGGLVSYITEKIVSELRALLPDLDAASALAPALAQVVDAGERPFVMIIDEWDAPIREEPAVAEEYLEFLRSLFKDSGITDKAFAAAYMTGILPIKKSKGQSAVSDFQEYSIIDPGQFAPYTGFLEQEVEELCDEAGASFAEAKRWYDGYRVGDVESVYNPYSLMMALKRGRFQSWWRKTSEADTLQVYLDLDVDGLQADVVRAMAGEALLVDPTGFKNDATLIEDKDDALTLMIHLGYLTYEPVDTDTGVARIPNQEIRVEFEKMLRKATHPELVRLVKASDKLLQDTLALDGDAVAAGIARVHDTNYAPYFYNGEQALRHTVKMAYIAAVDQYARVEELPSGHGLADVVFIPKHYQPLPAMVVELKWDQEPGGAIAQIRERDYAMLPADLAGTVLLVGITYDKASKEHRCAIEEVDLAAHRP